MNKYINIIAFMLLSTFMFTNLNADDTNQKSKYRSYASTRLAKVLLSKKVAPVDNVVEECDGSGWITHGDGHKTPCPGCPACKQQEEIKQYNRTKTLDEMVAALDDPKYYIYHFGSKTCVPCEQMKSQTWADQQVKDLIKQKKAKLIFLDVEDKDDDKFFSFYKVKYYPTIILLKVDNLEKPIITTVGFQDAKTMIKTLETNL